MSRRWPEDVPLTGTRSDGPALPDSIQPPRRPPSVMPERSLPKNRLCACLYEIRSPQPMRCASQKVSGVPIRRYCVCLFFGAKRRAPHRRRGRRRRIRSPAEARLHAPSDRHASPGGPAVGALPRYQKKMRGALVDGGSSGMTGWPRAARSAHAVGDADARGFARGALAAALPCLRDIVMAYIVMAYMGVAYVVMAPLRRPSMPPHARGPSVPQVRAPSPAGRQHPTSPTSDIRHPTSDI